MKAGVWILSNGEGWDIAYGSRGSVNLLNKPARGIANFHTHPNDPGGEQNINYVIGWNEIYRNKPNAHPLARNYETYTQRYIYTAHGIKLCKKNLCVVVFLCNN